jgi:hypothetical protein
VAQAQPHGFGAVLTQALGDSALDCAREAA